MDGLLPEFTPTELFTHALGACYRTEVDTGTGVRGWWHITDLNGNDIFEVVEFSDGWWTSPPLAWAPRGPYKSFSAAVDAHVKAINDSDGVQSDDLYWLDCKLPCWSLGG